MCSPTVMAAVRADVSRRRLLAAVAGGAALAVGAAAAPARAARQAATPAASPVASPAAQGPRPIALAAATAILDLSHVITPAFPMFPGARQPVFETIVTIENDGFYKQQLTFDEHTGTHMDAPAHFATDGATADQLPASGFVAPLVVIDIAARAETDPDAQLTPDDIAAWEAANGSIPAGAFVAMHSGWERFVGDAARFLNQDADGTPHFPGFHPEAAALLVEERDIVGIGVDTISIDYGASTDFATHLTVLPAGKYGLENLAMLGAAPPAGATVIVGGPKHQAAYGGPTRAFAVFQER